MMKLNNKAIKGLTLSVFLLSAVACTSHKSTDKDATEDQMGAETPTLSTDMNGTGLSSAEQARAQIEGLQKSSVVYFDFDQYDIKSDFDKILDAHADFLRNNPSYKVVIEGHTDERGTPEYNIALGERRANAVKMYLQGKGVSADQMSIVSYGKEKPAVLGHDAEAFSKNRRAVLVY